MFEFKVENLDKYTIVVNDKILVGIDCSGSMKHSEYVNGSYGSTLKTLESAELLGCIVADIRYETAYAGRYNWLMPCYVLYEKDGKQLEIRRRDDTISWKKKERKDNRKIKHTAKLNNLEGVLFVTSTGERDVTVF